MNTSAFRVHFAFMICLAAAASFSCGCSQKITYADALQMQRLERQAFEDLMTQKSMDRNAIEEELERRKSLLKAEQRMVHRFGKEKVNLVAEHNEASASAVEKSTKQIEDLAAQVTAAMGGDSSQLTNEELKRMFSAKVSNNVIKRRAAEIVNDIGEQGQREVARIGAIYQDREAELDESLKLRFAEKEQALENEYAELLSRFDRDMDAKILKHRKRLEAADHLVEKLAPN